MNNHTTARFPLRTSETVSVLIKRLRGEIKRDGKHGQFMNAEPARQLFSPEKFAYTVETAHDAYMWGAGIVITLTFLETGEEKIFCLAGVHDLSRIRAHMNSLTDDLMLSWFVKREKKTKKEKK